MGEGKRDEVTRRRFLGETGIIVGGLTVAPSLLTLAGCHREATTPGVAEPRPDGAPDASSGSTPAEPDGATPEPEQPEPAAPSPEPIADPRQGAQVRLDLVEHLHLADIDQGGLFIDFGTPARFKYTLGNWRTGWGADDESDDIRFTWAGASPGRLYFHLDEPAPLRIELRVKSRTANRISLYVNDHPVDRIEPPRRWTTQVVTVERAHTTAGENSLKLVHRSNSDRGRAFALDSIRIIPRGAEPAIPHLPRTATLISMADISGERRPGLILAAPTRLSWYIRLPEEPRLVMSLGPRAGTAQFTVQVTSARSGESRTLTERTVEPGTAWSNLDLDLRPEGGQVVRLDLIARAEPSEADRAAPDGGTPPAPAVHVATPAIVTDPVRLSVNAPPRPRHIIILLVDTLRADKLSVYAQTRVQTPQVTRFAREATLFQRCQAPANWTKPSCASVLTGLHPPSHRALSERSSLPSSVRLLSELFHEAGFATAAMIANGYLAADFGFDRGWDFYRNYIRERRRTEAEHVFADAARWLEAHRDQRMFAYIQTIDPHVPYDPPDEDLRLYDPQPYHGPIRNRRTGYLLEDFKQGRVELDARDRRHLEALYDGEVTYHDHHFGHFLDRLEELGILDETLFVFCADHGEEFFEHDSVGHGHSLYQELLHVPLMFRGRDIAPRGARLEQVVSLVDIAPTVLEAAGLQVPEEIEGRSLLADLRGAPPPIEDAAFSSQWDTGNNRELSWTVRLADWKLRMRGPAISYLYDLENDPGEHRDVDRRFPIALRAARISLGQFLGAPSRRHWASAAGRSRRARRPDAPSPSNDVTLTPELCEQLHALGYFPDGCR